MKTKRNLQARWIIGLFLLFPSLSLAATYYVDGDVAKSGNGTSWATAFKTIQEGVDASVMYDSIWVKMGTYNLSAEITVDKAVYIYGGFDGFETQLQQRDWEANVTTVNGNETVRGFNINEAAGIDGFTITNGKTEESGGGIFVNGGFMVFIANCVFESNSATGHGGGIFNDGHANVTMTNSHFVKNTAGGSGGGIYNYENASVIIEDGSFLQNTAGDYGGGIYNYENASVTIEDGSFLQNTAGGSGGGIFNNRDVKAFVTNSRFANNTAGGGGGIYNLYASSLTTITNSLFYDNRASYGGGIRNGASSPTIRNCTFARNLATSGGGGIYNHHHASPNITNSIFWGNSINQIHSESYSYPTVTYSDVQGGYSGEGNINADPLFEKDQPPGAPDFHLKAGSPAIDIATAEGAPDTDLDSNPRPSGEGYDLGAYEYQLVSLLQFSQDNYLVKEDGGTVSLTVTRKGNSDGAVSVKYATSDDTATAGSDYEAKTGTLSWDDGEDVEKTITINISDDSDDENNETFIVSLGETTGDAVLGSPDTAVTTIIDDDGGAFIYGCLYLNGSPVKKAKVIIKQKGEKNQKTKTDAAGCYRFDKAASGKTFKITVNGPEVP
jgi:predicted outer membrane repeat protein